MHPSTINAKQWEWMKRYRVWEANRKIFLFPENWLEPEFRDNKTHLFAELEGTLLQGDVSSDLVEDAFLNYLRKLDELARLDIVAMYVEDNSDPALRTLHVFGRTYNQPHNYFYRRYAHQMWTPWEPVTAEIEGDHLAPVVWRDRLYLFWVTFIEKAKPEGDTVEVDYSTPVTISGSVETTVEAQLHWSEYLEGEWHTRESGEFDPPDAQKLVVDQSVKPRRVFVHVSKEDDENGEERGVYIHLSWPFNQAFYLAGRNSAPERGTYDGIPAHPFMSAWGNGTVRATKFTGDGPFMVAYARRMATTEAGSKSVSVETPSILQQGNPFTLLPPNSNLAALGVSEDAYQNAQNPDAVKQAIKKSLDEIASLIKPVFYQDNRHTFFVEPNVTERTIEEWHDWITPTPKPEPGWRKPGWWEDLVVIPETPWKWPIPDPGDPWHLPIDSDSLINPVPDRDWLINPATAIQFGEVLIGPAGQPGIEVLTTPDAATSHGLMNVHPASGMAGGSTVLMRDPDAFAQSGLKAIGGGLNIIGSAGFNSALERNYQDQNRSGFSAEGFARGGLALTNGGCHEVRYDG